jgi:3-methyladenine DNA glycosylase/8-oxoguanine DNA glycosylase
MNLFGALVFAIIGQQISVIAAMAIFARLTARFGRRAHRSQRDRCVDRAGRAPHRPAPA